MQIAELIMELEGYRLDAYEEGGEHFFGCRLRSLTMEELRSLVKARCAHYYDVLRTAIPSFEEMSDGEKVALMLLMHYMGERSFFQRKVALASVDTLALPANYKAAIAGCRPLRGEAEAASPAPCSSRPQAQ